MEQALKLKALIFCAKTVLACSVRSYEESTRFSSRHAGTIGR
jgi:hypothetical protein